MKQDKVASLRGGTHDQASYHWRRCNCLEVDEEAVFPPSLRRGGQGYAGGGSTEGDPGAHGGRQAAPGRVWRLWRAHLSFGACSKASVLRWLGQPVIPAAPILNAGFLLPSSGNSPWRATW